MIQKVLPSDIGVEATDAQIADWTGELSNQLLGRIKNKLLSHGAVLEMSTPTVFFGRELARKDTSSNIRRHLVFRHGTEPLLVTFDAVAAAGVELSPSVATDEPGIAEGELALF
jgi:hypothetical protein